MSNFSAGHLRAGDTLKNPVIARRSRGNLGVQGGLRVSCLAYRCHGKFLRVTRLRVTVMRYWNWVTCGQVTPRGNMKSWG